jgi:PIN domain nuclease of toxin-antitoxin system
MIQLDTHILLWRELEPEKLSAAARSAIELAALASEAIAISPITLWEIALLVRRTRILLHVPMQKFLESIEENYRVMPITAATAAQAERPFSERSDGSPDCCHCHCRKPDADHRGPQHPHLERMQAARVVSGDYRYASVNPG